MVVQANCSCSVVCRAMRSRDCFWRFSQAIVYLYCYDRISAILHNRVLPLLPCASLVSKSQSRSRVLPRKGGETRRCNSASRRYISRVSARCGTRFADRGPHHPSICLDLPTTPPFAQLICHYSLPAFILKALHQHSRYGQVLSTQLLLTNNPLCLHTHWKPPAPPLHTT